MSSNQVKKINKKPLGIEYVFAAISGVGAGVFTNPIDVIKIRLQLQGELEARGAYKKVYKNTFHAAYIISKYEGILALQSGFFPALGFQVFLNGIRLGTYHFAKGQGIILNDKGEISIYKTSIISGIAGAVGAITGSPFYLVKTQLQSQSAKNTSSVGFQHQHANARAAFKHIWKENGFFGLYRGWYANLPKTCLGSAVQMTVFGLLTDFLKSFENLSDKPLTVTFLSSLGSGCSLAFVTQPFDVVSTRLYNQGTDASGKGVYYNGLFDALYKIFKIEGILGLYKGIFPTWMRSAPHVILCQVFYENLAEMYDEFYS